MNDRSPCPVCAAPTGDGDRFCATCGARVRPDPAAETPPPGSAPAGRFAPSWAVGDAGAAPESPGAATAPLATAQSAPAATAPASAGTPLRADRPATAGSRPGRQVALGALLLLLGAVLVMVGQADETGTLVIIAFLIAPFAALYVLVGLLRAVFGLFGGSRSR